MISTMLVHRLSQRPRLLPLALSCLLASGMLAPKKAEATDPSEANANPEVEALVQRGIELRREGKDDEALIVLRQAEKLGPTVVRTRVHLAATHQAVGHWLEADDYLRGVLSEPNNPYVERHRAALERAREYVEDHIGELEVSGGPAGAEVRLNGRELGALPLSRAVRVPIGSYELAVSHEGYYEVRRPVVLGSRGIVREAVDLEPIARPALPATPSRTGRASAVDRDTGSPRWLSWSLTGIAVGAGATTTVGFLMREKYASNWNSSDCLQQGFSRGDVCRDELDSGRTAERIGYVSAVATAIFAAGAIISWSFDGSSEGTASASLDSSCALTLAGASCQGSF